MRYLEVSPVDKKKVCNGQTYSTCIKRTSCIKRRIGGCGSVFHGYQILSESPSCIDDNSFGYPVDELLSKKKRVIIENNKEQWLHPFFP